MRELNRLLEQERVRKKIKGDLSPLSANLMLIFDDSVSTKDQKQALERELTTARNDHERAMHLTAEQARKEIRMVAAAKDRDYQELLQAKEAKVRCAKPAPPANCGSYKISERPKPCRLVISLVAN